MAAQHPDLAAEQAHVDRAYERLEEMRAQAARDLEAAFAHGRGGGTHQTLVERDVFVANAAARLARLSIGGEALCFGRIDRRSGERFHIGRVAVSAADHEPLVVDWRAPVAEAFYRATGREPLGLVRRRHFLTEGRRIVGIEDELFDGGGGLGLAGGSALVAALERSRTGRMRDIVATVQREQDEIIRAPLPGVLVVQGGPGTGKTAVALHRAAYLLYTHRFPLERQGVLVVGPNRLFMKYVSLVLPSLGETGVEMSTVAGLVASVVPDVTPTLHDPPAVSRLKGDARMAAVLARAVRDRERPLRTDIAVGYGAHVLRIDVATSVGIVRAARRGSGPHNQRREIVERLLFRRLHAQLRAALRRRDPTSGLDAEPSVEELTTDLRRHPAVIEALERMWPVLTPTQLLRDLFGSPALVRSAARGILSPDEQRLLHRPRGTSVAEARWSAADLPLLDEAAALLGPPPRHRSDGDGAHGPTTYGHVVVDEAQDLTPMELRVLARRSLGSMTLVGDIAQATGRWAPASWDEVLAHLPTRRPARVARLSVNYRTPAEIMALARRALAAALPGVEPPSSVRATGDPPRIVPVREPGALAARVADVTVGELASLGEGTVGVVCPSSLVASLAAALAEVGVDAGSPEDRALDAPVSVVPVEMAKGLEFDAVVVVEPAGIVEESPTGFQALYVALTRATRRLTLVHARPLPDPLRE
jgi:DNA helicase IV